ncbi:hypothetical protein JYT90_01085, partial [bacterium AH-315-P07]|nr:hypothetical protein [bacterium AH-315-P07]
DALERAMSYEEARDIIGEEGTLISSESARIEPGLHMMSLHTEIFEWQNEDNSVMRLLFKSDRLNEMTQVGLE